MAKYLASSLPAGLTPARKPAPWFCLGLAATASFSALPLLLAWPFLIPQLGSRDSILHPEILSNIGIAIILFLQGLSHCSEPTAYFSALCRTKRTGSAGSGFSGGVNMVLAYWNVALEASSG